MTMLRRITAFVTFSALAALSTVVQAPPTVAASTGTLFAVLGESQVVKLDPATGAHITLATSATGVFGDLVSNPATHTLYSQESVFSFDPSIPTTYHMDAIDTRTGAVTASADMPDQVSLAIDSASGTLYGLTSCCPSSIVRIDPATGAETPVATLNGTAFSSMTVLAHTIYVARISFDTFPATENLIAVDPATGSATAGPSLASGVIILSADSAGGALYGKTFCCPTHIVRIDPGTGAETALGSFDLGFGNSLAIDQSTHTIYAMEDVLGATEFDQFVATINAQNGSISLSSAIPLNGYIRGLAFEGVAITPASVIADVQSAFAGGLITSAGVENALLSQLGAAGDARSRSQCAVASNDYQAFINTVQAQSGKTIAAASAAKLVGEAQYLQANCP